MGSISFRSSYFWHSLVSNDLHSLLRLFSLAAAASPRSHDRTITHYDAQMRGSQAVRARATQMRRIESRGTRYGVNACGADVALTGRGR